MTEFLNELSENQINYPKQQKKHKYIVGISRILIQFSLSLGIHCKCRYHRLLHL